MWQDARMLVLRTTDALVAWREALPPGTRIGFVPTMGYLHDGHLSLVASARAEVGPGPVVLSIFVNPTQFGPNEDLDRYPRDEPGDLGKCEAAGVDVVLAPLDPTALYPNRSAGLPDATWVDVQGLDRHLCGRSRPGHFRGVCTVVCKLLSLVRPDVSVFGQKDFQQLAIIRRMHADLFLPGRIVGAPIVREPDGLAMSSRNANLTPDARRDAVSLSRWLGVVRERFAAGVRDREALLADAEFASGRIDYVELVDALALEPVARVDAPALCAIAVFFGGVRLIDNTLLVP
jgi:pantoate--beta-alanine ligase